MFYKSGHFFCVLQAWAFYNHVALNMLNNPSFQRPQLSKTQFSMSTGLQYNLTAVWHSLRYTIYVMIVYLMIKQTKFFEIINFTNVHTSKLHLYLWFVKLQMCFFFYSFSVFPPPPQYNMELNVSYRHLLNYYSMHYCYSRDWLKNKNYILLASQDYSAVIEPNSCIQWEYALGLTYTCAMNHVDTLEITAKVRNKCLNFNHLLVRCHFQQIPSLYKLVIPPYKLYFSHSESWHDWYSALRHKHLWVILRVFLCFVTSFNTKVVLVKNKTHTP